MRIRDADDFAFVLENQDVRHVPVPSELEILRLPDAQEILDGLVIELRKREIVARRIADDARESTGVRTAIDRRLWCRRMRRMRRHARQVVVEDERVAIRRVALAVYAPVARAEITVLHIRGQRDVSSADFLAAPRPVLPVSGDDDPFFTQRMPTLLPHLST